MPRLFDAMESITNEATRLCTSIYLRTKDGSYDDVGRLTAVRKMGEAHLFADRIASYRQDAMSISDVDLTNILLTPETVAEAQTSVEWAEGVTLYLKARRNLLGLRELARSVGATA
jgi:hypothetical protein